MARSVATSFIQVHLGMYFLPEREYLGGKYFEVKGSRSYVNSLEHTLNTSRLHVLIFDCL